VCVGGWVWYVVCGSIIAYLGFGGWRSSHWWWRRWSAAHRRWWRGQSSSHWWGRGSSTSHRRRGRGSTTHRRWWRGQSSSHWWERWRRPRSRARLLESLLLQFSLSLLFLQHVSEGSSRRRTRGWWGWGCLCYGSLQLLHPRDYRSEGTHPLVEFLLGVDGDGIGLTLCH